MKTAFCLLPVLLIGLCLPVFCQSNVSSLSEPSCAFTGQVLELPDLHSDSVTLQIQGASNELLGENGQGVCGVHLTFEHEYIGDVTMTLTSPSGQTVTLISPVGFFGPTDFIAWDIDFVACNAPSFPDPGFSQVWSNNQHWNMFNSYTGSYYPSMGCLQDFTGPVNGAWTLSITDGQVVDGGSLYDFEILFCDSSGIACSSCLANAGILYDEDFALCAGSSALNLNLTPFYFGSSPAPPSTEYGYTYIISQMSNGVILDYDADADLSDYPVGNYTVCGMSYALGADTLFPAPNNSLTTAQLASQLNAALDPVCARITSNCVNVSIRPQPQDSILYDTICAPECYNFFGSSYCNTGIYITHPYQNGCSYSATLHLKVVNPAPVFLRDTICAGTCSTVPGFTDACSGGVYVKILPASTANSCDTMVNLVLFEWNPIAEIIAPFTAISCTAESILLNAGPVSGLYDQTWKNLSTGETFDQATYEATQAGMYSLTTTVPGFMQCSQSDTVEVTSLPDMIEVLSFVDTLPCFDTSVVLNAGANGSNLSYSWTGPEGFTSTLQNPVVHVTGSYTLTASDDTGCTGTGTVVVVPSDETPVITAILIKNPSNGQQNGSIDIQVTGPSDIYAYLWYSNSEIISNSQSLSEVGPGNYQCVVYDVNGCQSTRIFILTNTDINTEYIPETTWGIRPNPSPGHILIGCQHCVTGNNAQLFLYNSWGSLVWQQQKQEDRREQAIDLSGLPSGMYFMEIRDGVRSPTWLHVALQK